MSLLFSPITIRQTTFRNRVVMPPMVRELSDPDGCVTDAVVDNYVQRASAGTGLIIVEATAVEPAGRCWPGGLCAYAPQHLPGLRRLAQAIQAEGAVAAIQLVHGGPLARSAVSGQETVGPSAIRPKHDYPIPRSLTVEEIQAIEAHFADAAALVAEAGFQAIEIHAAHGYLLDSFLMAKRNQRDDAYGATLPGRMRMLVETCRLVRSRISADVLLGCRICVFNKSSEGFTPADFAALVAGLDGAGLDLLHLSTEGAFMGNFEPPKPLGIWARETTRLPLIVAGRLGDPRDAERCLAEGIADFIAVGSHMVADPAWTAHARRVLHP